MRRLAMYIRIDDIAHTWCAVATGAAIPKVEAVFCYDLKDGAPLGSGLGAPNSVYIPDKALSTALDGQRVVKVVHSHPNGSENVSLSAVDLAGALELCRRRGDRRGTPRRKLVSRCAPRGECSPVERRGSLRPRRNQTCNEGRGAD